MTQVALNVLGTPLVSSSYDPLTGTTAMAFAICLNELQPGLVQTRLALARS